MVSKRFLKKKDNATKKPSKNSIKVTNKQQNKLNKSKKRKVEENKLKKALKQAKRDGKLNKNQENENSDDDQLRNDNTFFSHVNNKRDVSQENGAKNDSNNEQVKRRAKKRKDLEKDLENSIESKYKVKSASVQNGSVLRKTSIQLALPIKTQAGYLIKNIREEEPDQEEIDEIKKSKVEKALSNKVIEIEVEKPKSFVEQLKEKQDMFNKTKEKVAYFSRDIIENPQREMKKLKELRNMLNMPDIRTSIVLRKLIIVSMCEIFKDIVPSYKIRPWTEKENEQNVGKDVQELKEYEESLVKQYKLYIDYLSDSIKNVIRTLFSNDKSLSRSDVDSLQKFYVICVRCLCSLSERLSHFNFASDIILIVVHQLTSKTNEVAQLASDTVISLFKADKDLKLSLEITQKLTKMLRQKSYGVKPEVLDIFLYLRVKEINIVEEKGKKMTHKEKMKVSRSERKKIKEKELLASELEEKKVSDRLKEKSKLQARILEQIFMVYFNILKKSPNFRLIPNVLEGLAKFAHLINLDFFEDLIKLMHEMIESDGLTFRSKLHCIKTVFIVLSGQGESLSIDPIKFYASLYTIILQLNVAGDMDNTKLLADCIDMMFLRRRKQIPTSRLLAFIKRLSILTTQLEPASAVIVFNIIQKLISLNKSSDLLFDNEYQDSGIYNPELNEPDYANAQNTSLWELHLLRRHYNRTVGSEAANLLKQTTLGFNDLKITNQEIIDRIHKEEESLLNDPINIKKKNFK